MERILERLVGSATEDSVEGEEEGTGDDLNMSNDDMNDVMKVLTGFDDYAEAVSASENGSGVPKEMEVDGFTSVQDMAKVVDKATLANEKFLELSHHQVTLDQRYQAISRRLNRLRCLTLGTHISEELSNLRNYCEKVAPPLPPPLPPPAPPSLAGLTASGPPKMPNFNLGNLKPLNMPDGVVLPNVPHQSPVQLPTQPVFPLPQTPDVKVKEEIDAEMMNGAGPSTSSASAPIPSTSSGFIPPKFPHPKLPPPNFDEKLKTDEVLGQLNSNLKHIMDDYDSDATESSSGGESCDEQDNFSNRSDKMAPIKKRAKWTWLNNRASIASKWTWLTAQISDLEYRIRQQTDFYRQIRAAKGAVTLGEPTISWPAHAKKAVHDPGTEIPLSVKPPTRDYSRVDSSGRKIIIKELAPMAISPEELEAAANQNDDTFTACRTRPIKTLRRRRILGTLGLHRTSSRAAKESTVKCDCIRPTQWCAICFGRSNHLMAPDPVNQDKSRTAALLDHSYHQVLSSKHDVPLELQMMQLIKNRSWLVSGQVKAKTGDSLDDKKKKKLKKLAKEELLDSKNKRKLKRRESEGSGVMHAGKKKIKIRHDKYRRKSVTVHHQDGHASMVDIASDDAIDASPLPSPLVTSSERGSSSHHGNLSIAEQIRKKRETAFDIDNIVIPYSIAASTRVEKLKYKEILTPTWRMIEHENNSSLLAPPTPGPSPASSAPTTPQDTPAKQPRLEQPLPKRKGRSSKKSLTSEESLTITAEMAEAAASAATTHEEYLSVKEDISDTAYQIRHSKAEIEEQKRWSKPLKVIGMGSGPNRNRSSRRQNSQADNSGCNTPDPMSPGSVEKVDTLEVNTRPSSPDADQPQSIKNRRRTSSTTKSRDRNPSEDAQSSRCTTPGAEHNPHANNSPFEPFEPRRFPLTDDEYTTMQDEMPSGYDQNPEPEDAPTETGDNESVDQAAGAAPSSRRPSSQDSSTFDDDANEEEDEDWSGDLEDPDDPEWTGREDAVHTSGGSTSVQKGHRKASTSNSAQAHHQNHHPNQHHQSQNQQTPNK